MVAQWEHLLGVQVQHWQILMKRIMPRMLWMLNRQKKRWIREPAPDHWRCTGPVKVPMSHRFPFEHSNEKWWHIPHTASEHTVVFPVEPGSALGNVDLCSAWDCKVHSLGTTKHAEVATGQSHLELISLQRQLWDHTDSKWTTFC